MLAIAFAIGCNSSPKNEKKAAAFHTGKIQNLKAIDPEVGYKPDIGNDAKNNLKQLNALYNKVDSTIKSYPSYDIAKQHLTRREIEVYENEEQSTKGDHLDIKTWGCSWYCGGFPDSITSSSTLKAINKSAYKATNAHDFSLRTAWVAGGKNSSVGESITYRFPEKTPAITTIIIFNGYLKSNIVWSDNARVKTLKMYVNDKPYAMLNLKDTIAKQVFSVGNIQETKGGLYLKFEIIEVYKGNKYNDVAISEIEFEGVHVH